MGPGVETRVESATFDFLLLAELVPFLGVKFRDLRRREAFGGDRGGGGCGF